MLTHTCHAIGCKKIVPPIRLFCYKHWCLVPTYIRDAVWRHYRPGQCDDKRPSKEWFLAADAAIAQVAFYEGKLDSEQLGDKLLKAQEAGVLK